MPKISELDAPSTAALKAKAGTTTLPSDLAGKAPIAPAFVVVGAADAALPNERRLVAGANVTITDGGAGGTIEIASTGGGGGGGGTAVGTTITDAGGYYTGGNVEAALQEAGSTILAQGTSLSGKAPLAPQYLIVGANDASLPNERRLVAGAGITITDNGAGSSLSIALTGGGAGTVTSVGLTVGTGMSITGASPITGSGTWALSLSANLQSWSGIAPAAKVDVSALAASSGASLMGFIRTGTGATARTMQDRVREFISVRDYGALGDGTTNDRTAIVNADAAAFAAGKALFLPAGTYMVGAQIYGLKASWFGEDGTIVRATAAVTLNLDALLTWVTVDDIFVQDIEFDLQSRPVTAGAEGVIAFLNCGGFFVERCRVINLTGAGISVNGGRRFCIENNFISKATASTGYNQAILVSSSSRQSTDGSILRNYLYRSAINVSCVDCWIDSNYITGWGFGAGVTSEQDTANSIRCRITNNTIEGSLTSVDVNGYRPGGIENWAPYSIIAGNYVGACAGAGVDQGGRYTVVRDNVVLNCGTSGSDNTPGPQTSGGDGINTRYGNATYNGSYSTIVNNTMVDTRAAGDKMQGYGYADQSASVAGVYLHGNRYDGNFLGDENILGSAGWNTRVVSANGNMKTSTTGSGKLEFSPAAAFASEVSLESGNRLKLQGAANLTGVRYSSPNVEIFVGSSLAAGFGTNTTGFNGTSPVAKPTITGSRGGNAALASLLTALASMGLITDSSS